MTKMIVVSLPVADLGASTGFYKALGFEMNMQFSDTAAMCMVWSKTIQVMLLTHAKWQSITDRPLAPAGSAKLMLSLSTDSREAVDRMNEIASERGGRADVNPVQDQGTVYSRDFSDPDGHLWSAFWMDATAAPAGSQEA